MSTDPRNDRDLLPQIALGALLIATTIALLFTLVGPAGAHPPLSDHAGASLIGPLQINAEPPAR